MIACLLVRQPEGIIVRKDTRRCLVVVVAFAVVTASAGCGKPQTSSSGTGGGGDQDQGADPTNDWAKLSLGAGRVTVRVPRDYVRVDNPQGHLEVRPPGQAGISVAFALTSY